MPQLKQWHLDGMGLSLVQFFEIMTPVVSYLLGLALLLHCPTAFLPMTTTVADAPQTFIMLAHRWEGEGGYLDLDLNGTFEGSLDGKSVYYGNWSLGSDEKTMTLTHDPMDEEEFEWIFQVTHLSFDALHLQLNNDKTWTLKLVD